MNYSGQPSVKTSLVCFEMKILLVEETPLLSCCLSLLVAVYMWPVDSCLANNKAFNHLRRMFFQCHSAAIWICLMS